MTSRSLRVGFNLLWLRPGVVGGTENAAAGILGAWSREPDRGIEMQLYAQSSFESAHPDLVASFPTHTKVIPTGARAVRVAIESSWLPLRVRRDHLDVMHCYGGVVPPGVGVPSVLTLHDVQPLESGSVFGAGKSRWLTTMIPRSVDMARVVLVPSNFVRDRVIDLLDVDPSKVVVHPHGVRSPVDPPLDDGRAAELRRRFRLPSTFILYPAITYPHKNHRLLVDAFARLRTIHPETTLVLTGGAGSAEHEVMTAVERLGIGSSVRRVGRIEDAAIADLYRLADVVAVPSRYEGFGFPVLQALHAGTPVVASNVASLPEVVGAAGLLVDPDSPDEWAAALATVLEGGPSVQKMVDAGRQQAKSLSWDRLVPMLIAAYRRAAGDERRGRK